MKGYHFYEEFTNTGKGVSAGSVLAIDVSHDQWRMAPAGFAAIYGDPDSPVAYVGISFDWLDQRCKRVTETRARQIHPALFGRLDAWSSRRRARSGHARHGLSESRSDTRLPARYAEHLHRAPKRPH